ncbi:MAG: hypothetical protein JSR18_03195 [Proteobacteria bacterium]|nr:hypothetical protein [Pseudomonadota bacterium]
MRNVQPVDAWSAYFSILSEALSAGPGNTLREARREVPPLAVAPVARADRRSVVAANASSLAPGAADADLAAGTPATARRGWLDRLDHWFWKSRQAMVERRLAAAGNIYELEAEMRAVERPGSSLF